MPSCHVTGQAGGGGVASFSAASHPGFEGVPESIHFLYFSAPRNFFLSVICRNIDSVLYACA